MKRIFILLLLIVMIGCNKSPTEIKNNPPPPNINYSGKIHSLEYYYAASPSPTFFINFTYYVQVDSAGLNRYTDKADTLTTYFYLSSGHAFIKTVTPFSNSVAGDSLWLIFPSRTYPPDYADTATTMDSLIVYYFYWSNATKYGPYKNKYINPPIIKNIYGD